MRVLLECDIHKVHVAVLQDSAGKRSGSEALEMERGGILSVIFLK